MMTTNKKVFNPNTKHFEQINAKGSQVSQSEKFDMVDFVKELQTLQINTERSERKQINNAFRNSFNQSQDNMTKQTNQKKIESSCISRRQSQLLTSVKDSQKAHLNNPVIQLRNYQVAKNKKDKRSRQKYPKDWINVPGIELQDLYGLQKMISNRNLGGLNSDLSNQPTTRFRQSSCLYGIQRGCSPAMNKGSGLSDVMELTKDSVYGPQRAKKQLDVFQQRLVKYQSRNKANEYGKAGSMKRLLENLKLSDKQSLNILSPKSFDSQPLGGSRSSMTTKNHPFVSTGNVLGRLTQSQYQMDWIEARDCQQLARRFADTHFQNIQRKVVQDRMDPIRDKQIIKSYGNRLTAGRAMTVLKSFDLQASTDSKKILENINVQRLKHKFNRQKSFEITVSSKQYSNSREQLSPKIADSLTDVQENQIEFDQEEHQKLLMAQKIKNIKKLANINNIRSQNLNKLKMNRNQHNKLESLNRLQRKSNVQDVTTQRLNKRNSKLLKDSMEVDQLEAISLLILSNRSGCQDAIKIQDNKTITSRQQSEHNILDPKKLKSIDLKNNNSLSDRTNLDTSQLNNTHEKAKSSEHKKEKLDGKIMPTSNFRNIIQINDQNQSRPQSIGQLSIPEEPISPTSGSMTVKEPQTDVEDVQNDQAQMKKMHDLDSIITNKMDKELNQNIGNSTLKKDSYISQDVAVRLADNHDQETGDINIQVDSYTFENQISFRKKDSQSVEQLNKIMHKSSKMIVDSRNLKVFAESYDLKNMNDKASALSQMGKVLKPINHLNPQITKSKKPSQFKKSINEIQDDLKVPSNLKIDSTQLGNLKDQVCYESIKNTVFSPHRGREKEKEKEKKKKENTKQSNSQQRMFLRTPGSIYSSNEQIQSSDYQLMAIKSFPIKQKFVVQQNKKKNAQRVVQICKKYLYSEGQIDQMVDIKIDNGQSNQHSDNIQIIEHQEQLLEGLTKEFLETNNLTCIKGSFDKQSDWGSQEPTRRLNEESIQNDFSQMVTVRQENESQSKKNVQSQVNSRYSYGETQIPTTPDRSTEDHLNLQDIVEFEFVKANQITMLDLQLPDNLEEKQKAVILKVLIELQKNTLQDSNLQIDNMFDQLKVELPQETKEVLPSLLQVIKFNEQAQYNVKQLIDLLTKDIDVKACVEQSNQNAEQNPDPVTIIEKEIIDQIFLQVFRGSVMIPESPFYQIKQQKKGFSPNSIIKNQHQKPIEMSHIGIREMNIPIPISLESTLRDVTFRPVKQSSNTFANQFYIDDIKHSQNLRNQQQSSQQKQDLSSQFSSRQVQMKKKKEENRILNMNLKDLIEMQHHLIQLQGVQSKIQERKESKKNVKSPAKKDQRNININNILKIESVESTAQEYVSLYEPGSGFIQTEMLHDSPGMRQELRSSLKMNQNIGPITIKKMFSEESPIIEKGHGHISQDTDNFNARSKNQDSMQKINSNQLQSTVEQHDQDDELNIELKEHEDLSKDINQPISRRNSQEMDKKFLGLEEQKPNNLNSNLSKKDVSRLFNADQVIPEEEITKDAASASHASNIYIENRQKNQTPDTAQAMEMNTSQLSHDSSMIKEQTNLQNNLKELGLNQFIVKKQDKILIQINSKNIVQQQNPINRGSQNTLNIEPALNVKAYQSQLNSSLASQKKVKNSNIPIEKLMDDLSVFGLIPDKVFISQNNTSDNQLTQGSARCQSQPSQMKSPQRVKNLYVQQQHAYYKNQLPKQDQVLQMGQRSPTPPLPALIGQQLQFTKRSTTPAINASKKKRKSNNILNQSMIQSKPPLILNRGVVYSSPNSSSFQEKEKLKNHIIQNSTIPQSDKEEHYNTQDSRQDSKQDDKELLIQKHLIVENTYRKQLKSSHSRTNREGIRIKNKSNKDLMELDSKNYKIGGEDWV